MREIRFRGLDTETGDWVKGFYVCLNSKEHRIYDGYAETDCGDYYPDFCKVSPETVGQYTGLTDKNGVEIYDGDIIRYVAPDGMNAIGCVRFDMHGATGTCAVGFFVDWRKPNAAGWLRQDLGFWARFRDIEIIGNINEHPKLMEVSDG